RRPIIDFNLHGLQIDRCRAGSGCWTRRCSRTGRRTGRRRRTRRWYRIQNVLRVCDLKDAALCVIGDEDLAIAVGVVFILGSDVTVRSENYEAPVSADIARRGVESKRAGSELNGEWVWRGARRLS